MPKHRFRVHVTVVEEDEQGKVLSELCGHRSICALDGDPGRDDQRRADYCHWAYEGFKVATNGPAGLLERPSDATALKLLVLKTAQLDAVRTFYESLGITFTEEQHGRGPVHYAGRSGATLVEVYPLPAGRTADNTTRIGFDVDDLHKVLAALQVLGTPVLSPHEQSAASVRLTAVVRDPDGRAVELYQRTDTGWDCRPERPEYYEPN
jgi:hypothetical protein